MTWLRVIKAAELHHGRLFLLILAIIFALILVTPPVSGILEVWVGGLGELGLVGAFITGIIASFGITMPPAEAVIFLLGGDFAPWIVAAIGASGATVANLITYELAKKRLAKMFIAEEHKHPKLSKWTHRFAPLIIGIIEASPIPDQVAAGLVGAMKFDEKEFIIIVYFTHFLVMLSVATAGSILV